MNREPERKKLAVAMGYEIVDQAWTRPHEHESPSRLVLKRKEWSDHARLEFESWNPFRNAGDLLALMEWVRTRRWTWDCFPNDVKVFTARTSHREVGSLLEAFPLAVIAALDAEGNSDID